MAFVWVYYVNYRSEKMKEKWIKLKIKILSPVHIGSGEEITPIEYLITDNKFIKIDMDSLFTDEEFKQKQLIEDFIKKSSEGNRYIGDIVSNDLLKKHTLYSIDISNTAQEYIKSHKINIRAFIKSANRVYIPGSSLKGSILSGVIEQILSKKNINRFNNYEDHLRDVLNEITNGEKLGRFSKWLDVRDSELKSVEESLEVVKTEIIGARTNEAIPVLYEALKTGMEFETEIRTQSQKDEKELLEIASNFYKEVYKKEKNFFKEKNINVQLPQLSNNTYILRLGQGSTAWSTSFLILAEELNIRNYTIQRSRFHRISGPPRTRKLVSGTISMGWVEIKIEN